MPVTTSRSGLKVRISGIDKVVDSPDLIIALGTHLATLLSANANRDTGAMAAALGYVGRPERTATGWAIGVGDPKRLGKKDDPAPRGTLRDFFQYLGNSGMDYRVTDWWGLSPENKRLLATMRRGGKFGGRGPEDAPYMWVQNYGNATAGISGRWFIEESLSEFRADVPEIVKAFTRA